MTDEEAFNHLTSMRASRLEEAERCRRVVHDPKRRDGTMRNANHYRARAALAEAEAEAITHVLKLAQAE